MDRSADARDLRAGGTWTPLQRAKNDVIFAVSMLVLSTSRLLPLPALRAVGRGIGIAAHALARKARRTALTNVRRVFPGMTEAARRAFVRRSFVTMGELLADAVALLRPRSGPLLDVDPEARAVIEEARREGRGVIFASAHLGPVGAGRRLARGRRHSAHDPRARELRPALHPPLRAAPGRARRGGGVSLGRAGASMKTTARIVRALRGGGVLGFPMDLRARVASCEAPFLGHAASTAVGPARIALRTGAAVVVGTVAPRGASLVVTATRISARAACHLRAEEAAIDLTMRINGELSRRIMALPHAWVWMHERWIPTRRV